MTPEAIEVWARTLDGYGNTLRAFEVREGRFATSDYWALTAIATALREAEARGLDRAAQIVEALPRKNDWCINGPKQCAAAIRAEKERTP